MTPYTWALILVVGMEAGQAWCLLQGESTFFMPAPSLDPYIRNILRDGFPSSFLEYCARLLHDSGIDLAVNPQARLYLQHLSTVMEILVSENGEHVEIVKSMKERLSDEPLPENAAQWVEAASAAAGDRSLGTVSLALGLHSYHKATQSGRPDLFLESFVRGWIGYFGGV